ncbi:MAG: zinc metallopeptidase [Clostridiales bacterium]|nr:zinc metallopeptidase [Clostridiales bacterium]
MYYAYLVYYILGIVMIPGIILGIWAQSKVYTTFNKYAKIDTKSGKSAKDVARYMLNSGGCGDTKIQPIKGELTDNYNPKTNTVSLSESVYDQSTVAAIGVTAHEVGHVFQHQEKYTPIKVRNALVPVLNVCSSLTWVFLFIGIIMELVFQATMADVFLYIGAGLYALNIVFCLVTLPVELNASKRAYNMLVATGEMDNEEAKGVKKVLNAAAWTYVAALVTSILSLLRLLLFIFTIRGDRS